MGTADMTGTLGFGSLIVALLIAIVLLVRFMRKPQNRHPLEGKQERNIAEVLDREHNRTTNDRIPRNIPKSPIDIY